MNKEFEEFEVKEDILRQFRNYRGLEKLPLKHMEQDLNYLNRIEL